MIYRHGVEDKMTFNTYSHATCLTINYLIRLKDVPERDLLEHWINLGRREKTRDLHLLDNICSVIYYKDLIEYLKEETADRFDPESIKEFEESVERKLEALKKGSIDNESSVTIKRIELRDESVGIRPDLYSSPKREKLMSMMGLLVTCDFYRSSRDPSTYIGKDQIQSYIDAYNKKEAGRNPREMLSFEEFSEIDANPYGDYDHTEYYANYTRNPYDYVYDMLQDLFDLMNSTEKEDATLTYLKDVDRRLHQIVSNTTMDILRENIKDKELYAILEEFFHLTGKSREGEPIMLSVRKIHSLAKRRVNEGKPLNITDVRR